MGGTLNTNTNIIQAAFDLTFQKSGTGNVVLGNNGGAANELRFMEPAGGAEFTSIKAGAQASNINYTLPLTAPTADGAVMTSTSGGQMSWSNTVLSGFKGKVPCTGAITQSITGLTGITLGSTVIVTFEDGISAGTIALRVTGITAGTGFAVEFTAPPPVNAFINYIVLP